MDGLEGGWIERWMNWSGIGSELKGVWWAGWKVWVVVGGLRGLGGKVVGGVGGWIEEGWLEKGGEGCVGWVGLSGWGGREGLCGLE